MKAQRPVRVLHCNHSGGFYGAEKVIVDLVEQQLKEPDLEVGLLALLDPGQPTNDVAERVSSMGGRVTRLQVKPGLGPQSIADYAAAIGAHGTDLVHSHGYKVTAHHAVSRWLRRHRVPLFVTAHGYDGATPGSRAGLYRWLDLRLLGAADRVVAVSPQLESVIRAANPKCRLSVIRNGIRTDLAVRGTHPLRALLAAQSMATDNQPVIGAIGRLAPMKNHDLLIRAVAELRRERAVQLVIVGDGPLRPTLAALWRELMPGTLVNLVPFQSDILEWVADMDIFCLPSGEGEGLPIALLEAGILQRAAVCTRSGGIPELVRDGETGGLIPLGDQRGLVDRLRALLDDAALRSRLGNALAAEVRSHYDIRVTHALYASMYRELVRT